MSAVSPGPGSTASHTGEESSASSIINVDMSEGILVPEADAEVGIVDGEAGNAYVRASHPIGDEASKKALRDHLRRTLNKKDSYPGTFHPSIHRPNYVLNYTMTYQTEMSHRAAVGEGKLP
jgi:signal transduction protein with GAF and PtsI domain